MDAKLVTMPWSEVVKFKQERDHVLLQTVEHYRQLAESEMIPLLSREKARELMEQYQRIYLDLGERHGL